MRPLYVVVPLLLLGGAIGWSLRPSSGDLSAPRRAAVDEPVLVVSQGEEFDLADHLVPDEWTLFEFGADW